MKEFNKARRRSRIRLAIILAIAYAIIMASSCSEKFETITTSEFIDVGGAVPSNYLRVGAIRDAAGDKMIFHINPNGLFKLGATVELITSSGSSIVFQKEGNESNNFFQTPITFSSMVFLVENDVVVVRILDDLGEHDIVVTNRGAFKLLVDRIKRL